MERNEIDRCEKGQALDLVRVKASDSKEGMMMGTKLSKNKIMVVVANQKDEKE